MKRLSLLRHAKSSWSDKGLSDFERPLNARGREAAPRIGAFLASNNLVPDRILCSSAVRARETLALLLPYFRAPRPAVDYRDDLYLADPSVMLAALRETPAEAAHLLIIAHNPGLEMLALRLCDPQRSDTAARDRIAAKFPTAAFVSFAGPDKWTDFAKGACALDTYVTPKDLHGDR